MAPPTTDAELRRFMERSLEKLNAPFHLFTPPEVVEIVFLTRDQNAAALTKL